jgi:protein-S-isoprenylcysteine O-methyltransferase Ste14
MEQRGVDLWSRGAGWVIVQVILFALIALAPQVALPWTAPTWISVLFGLPFLLLGLFLLFASILNLGKNLTPYPRPLSDSQLVTTGVYSLVRHPMYFSVILLSLGFSLLTTNPIRLGLTAILFVFFDAKSRQEETWLKQKFPNYIHYQKRVKKLIPWLY